MQTCVMTTVLMLLVLVAPGCKKKERWNKAPFNQGTNVAVPRDSMRSYIRSITVYDQFKTVGMFDVLWLADPVRAGYVSLAMRKRGAHVQQERAFLKRQLDLNKKTITFYVLNRFDVPLYGPDAVWSLFLTVDGTVYQPIELEEIELEPEYKYLFGSHFSRFKQAHRVVFDAYADDEQQLLGPATKTMSLCFRSLKKQVALTWRVPGAIDSIGADKAVGAQQQVSLSLAMKDTSGSSKRKKRKR